MAVRWMRAAMAAGLALALSGCFLTPGQFGSTLDVRRDGRFEFAYQGEIKFLDPNDLDPSGGKTAPWSDDKAECYGAKPGAKGKPAADDDSMKRDCTPAEIAEQRKDYETEQAASAKRKGEEGQRFAKLFGYTPGDDEANRRLAQTLMKYDGYRSVVYKGKGVFQVDFRQAGRLDHDFVFPLVTQDGGGVLLPFVTIRRQSDGAVRVIAPAFVGSGGAGALAALRDIDGPAKGMPSPPPSLANGPQGSFVVTTDGAIRTNNTEDGPTKAAGGQQLSWRVGADRKVAPEALIGLR